MVYSWTGETGQESQTREFWEEGGSQKSHKPYTEEAEWLENEVTSHESCGRT